MLLQRKTRMIMRLRLRVNFDNKLYILYAQTNMERYPTFTRLETPSLHDYDYNTSPCLQNITTFWNVECTPTTDASPQWFHMHSKPYVDPYSRNHPEKDSTDHDLDSRKIFDFMIVGRQLGLSSFKETTIYGLFSVGVGRGCWQAKKRDLWDTKSKRRQIIPLWDTPMVKSCISKPNKKLINRPLDIVVETLLVDQRVLVLYSRLVQEEFDSYWQEKWKSGNFLPSFNKFKNYQCPTCASDNHGRDSLLTL